jgi:hypothetical protein
VTLLGVTNAGTRVLVKRGGRQLEAYCPTEPMRVIDFSDSVLDIACPNNTNHRVLAINLSLGDSQPEIILCHHRPYSGMVCANSCDCMSGVGIGGSKLVYRQGELVLYHDIQHAPGTERLLLRRVQSAHVAVSRHGEAAAIAYPSRDYEAAWMVRILHMQEPPLESVHASVFNLDSQALHQLVFSRDNTNLLVTFVNGVTHAIPHKISMLSMASSQQPTMEPNVFLNRDDGWIRYTIPGRHELREICWIPRHWLPSRDGSVVIQGALVIIEGSKGGFESPTLILDTLPAIEYMESLKSEGTEKERSC